MLASFPVDYRAYLPYGPLPINYYYVKYVTVFLSFYATVGGTSVFGICILTDIAAMNLQNTCASQSQATNLTYTLMPTLLILYYIYNIYEGFRCKTQYIHLVHSEKCHVLCVTLNAFCHTSATSALHSMADDTLCCATILLVHNYPPRGNTIPSETQFSLLG